MCNLKNTLRQRLLLFPLAFMLLLIVMTDDDITKSVCFIQRNLILFASKTYIWYYNIVRLYLIKDGMFLNEEQLCKLKSKNDLIANYRGN